MKNVLHFFGEFLVEGTGGSSVFKNFQGSSISDLTKPDQKHKSFKWSIYLDVDSEKGTTTDNFVAMNENVLKKRQLKSIKRHRRWNIGKVGNEVFHLVFAFISHTNLIYLFFYYFCISLLGFIGKSCPLDSLLAKIHCNRDFLQ